MEKNMTYTEFYDWVQGKTGTIYTCRKGTYMAFCIEDAGKSVGTFLLSTLVTNGRVIKNPAPEFWVNSIDFSGSFSTYLTFGVMPVINRKMPYKARPVVPISLKQRDRLRNIQISINNKKAMISNGKGVKNE